ANLIAHSMGGLVVLLAARTCGDHMQSVVYAGVPFRGCAGLFYWLFTGATTGMNSTLLRAEALWTFSSTWQMLPRTDDVFVDQQNRSVKLPVSQATTWEHWPRACPQLLEARLADRARMPLRLEAPAVPSLAVIGHGRATTEAVRVDGEHIDFTRS